MALQQTHSLRTLMSGCSMRTFASQPVLCCQQWREGVDLIHFYSTSCYSTLDTELGECLCLRCAWRRGRMIGRRPSQHTKHKCIDRARESERASGEELGWAFYHRGHNSISCKHCGKAFDQYTDCSAWAQPEQEKKGALAAHIKASSCCTVLQQVLLLNFC